MDRRRRKKGREREREDKGEVEVWRDDGCGGKKTGERGGERERERKKVQRAIYSNLTPDSMALNNRPRLRRNWSPFNNGLLSNELVLSVKRARPGSDITPE